MFVCEQNIIVKVSIVVTCVARDLILPRFQIICWNLWKAFGSIIPAVGLHSQYCWMLRYAPPQPKPERPILFAAWGRAAQAWWSNVGWWGMFSKKKNVVKPNSLDDNSKMIFFCWQTISCFVKITCRLLTWGTCLRNVRILACRSVGCLPTS